MSDTVRRQSPLHDSIRVDGGTALPAEAGVVFSERPFLSHLNLRGDSDNLNFVRAVRSVLDVDVPTTPNTWAGDKSRKVCWLGPDEWLILGSKNTDPADLVDRLRSRVVSEFAAFTNVSSGQTTIHLSGESVVDTLAKGCGLDFDGALATSGRCAQTLVAQAGVLLIRDETSIELVVRRSFADYLWRWLQDAGAEYGRCNTNSS